MACFFSNLPPFASSPATWNNEPFNIVECNGWDKCILKCPKCKCVVWDENESEYWYRTFDYNGKGHKSHVYTSKCVNEKCKNSDKPKPAVVTKKTYKFDTKPISLKRK